MYKLPSSCSPAWGTQGLFCRLWLTSAGKVRANSGQIPGKFQENSEPLGPVGAPSIGPPWGPGAPMGAHGRPWGAHGAPMSAQGAHGAPMGAHGLQLGPPRAKMARTSRAELGVSNSSADSADSGDSAETVSGAAVQTLPNHAQESQDDVSSQANSLKLLQPLAGLGASLIQPWVNHFSAFFSRPLASIFSCFTRSSSRNNRWCVSL